jgi:uncharacterized membrane protein YkoI
MPINRMESDMKRNAMISATLLAAGMATAGGLVHAQQGAATQDDAVRDLAKANISLVQAIVSAESQTGGKATRAELGDEHGSVAFEVEVVTSDGKVLDVRVDASNGTVLASKADEQDRGDQDRDEKD